MNRFLVAIFVAFLLALGLASCSGSKSPEEHIEYARSFRAAGDLDAAVVELKNALRQSPDNAQARWLIGSIYLDAGDGESAEKELRRSIESGMDASAVALPLLRAQMLQNKFQEALDQSVDEATLSIVDQVKVAILRGHAYMGLGDLVKAGGKYDEALALEEGNPEASLGKARIAALQGKLGAARKLIESLVEVHPEFAPAWSFVADMDQYLGNFEAAEQGYTRALEYRPDDVSDLANRALVRLVLGDLQSAAKDYNAARRGNALLRMKEPLVVYVKGHLNLKQNNFTAAASAFEKMVQVTPDYLAARYYLAAAHYKQGNLEQAEQNLTIFRNKAPQYPSGHRLHAAIKFSQGAYSEARQELENLLSFDPSDAWSLSLLADIDVLEGNPNQSVENYRRIVELQPESEPAHTRLALGLMMGAEDEAREVLNRALELGENTTQSRTLIMVSHMKQRNWDAAIESGRQMVEDDPQNWDALTLLGGAYLGKGSVAEARPLFEQALQLKPGNPNAAKNLAILEAGQGNLAAARSLYKEVLQHHPQETSAILALASLDYREEKFSDAVDRLETGVAKNPGNQQLKLALARLYLRTGRPSRNLNMGHDFGADQAGNPRILEVLGDSQSAMGQYEAALETYEKLAQVVPDDATAHYRLAREYVANNQLVEASQALEKVIALDPDHFGASVMSIRLLRKQARPDEALEAFNRVNPAFLERPEMLIEKGWVAMYEEKHAESVAAFSAAFDAVPSSILALQLGIARWNAGDKDGALAVYNKWLANNPEDHQVRFHLANSYMQLGRKTEAIAEFKAMLEQKPQDAVLVNNIAWLSRGVDADEALKFAQRTLEIVPDWPRGLDTMGAILLDQGEFNQAYRYFEQALKQAPQDREIRYHLALASSRMGENTQAVQILKAILAEPDVQFESRTEAEALMRTLQEKGSG